MTNTLYPDINNRSFSKTSKYRVGIGFCMEDDCKNTMFNSVLETHHILSKINGGLDIYENYIVLCRKCHKKQTKNLFKLTREQLIEEMDRLMDIKIKYEIKIFDITSFNICNIDFARLLSYRRKKIEIVNNICISTKTSQSLLNQSREASDILTKFNLTEQKDYMNIKSKSSIKNEDCRKVKAKRYYIKNRKKRLLYDKEYQRRPEVKKRNNELRSLRYFKNRLQ